MLRLGRAGLRVTVARPRQPRRLEAAPALHEHQLAAASRPLAASSSTCSRRRAAAAPPSWLAAASGSADGIRKLPFTRMPPRAAPALAGPAPGSALATTVDAMVAEAMAVSAARRSGEAPLRPPVSAVPTDQSGIRRLVCARRITSLIF